MPHPVPLWQQLATRPLNSSFHPGHQLHRNPVVSSLVPVLHACAVHKDAYAAAVVHARMLKYGVHASDAYIHNSLLNAYVKCGCIRTASLLFDRMPHRDAVSWTAMLSGLCQNGDPAASLSLFAAMLDQQGTEDDPRAAQPNEFTVAAAVRACAATRDKALGRAVHGYAVATGFARDPFVTSSLVDMYAKLGAAGEAEALVMAGAGNSVDDVVSWTSLISGHVTGGFPEEALSVFSRMLKAGTRPNLVTMLSAVRAASLAGNVRFFGAIHCLVVKLALQEDVSLGTSLLEMYARNGFAGESSEVFSQLFLSYERPSDAEVLSVILHACSLSRCLDLGEQLHAYSVKQGSIAKGRPLVENCLIDMYAKNEKPESAARVFSRMGVRDIATWNTMITSLAKNGRPEEALQLLAHVHRSGQLAPDFATFLGSLHACSELASLPFGRAIHGYAIRAGFAEDVFVGNAILDMYAKAGTIDDSRSLFDEMPTRDLSSWNAMVAAYGAHGDGFSALAAFRDLERLHRPNALSFTNVLSSCAHSGLVAEGMECFSRMVDKYGIEPAKEHYACVVDLLCRSGRIEEAVEFIGRMPVDPGLSTWRILLAACVRGGNLVVAEMAAERLSALESSCHAWRVALAHVYAMAGKWERAAEVRAETHAEGAEPEAAGWSAVELGTGETVRFVAADTRHPQSERIYEVIGRMKLHCTSDCSIDSLSGYVE